FAFAVTVKKANVNTQTKPINPIESTSNNFFKSFIVDSICFFLFFMKKNPQKMRERLDKVFEK
ncbi:MAG: hypothetical protein J6A87_00055, partial [Clostridia bacterium]|nr:hypothetical protein [Clostridia bacterium]